MDLDEETQLALALSISEAEAAGHRPSAAPRPPPAALSDEEFARKLQAKYDQEASAAPSRGAPAAQRPPPLQPTTAPGSCAGCGQSLLGPPPGSSFLGGLVSMAQPRRYITALNKNWHPGCFRCSACSKPLDGPFTVSDSGEAMHSECHRDRHHPRCGVCGDFLPHQPGTNRIVWQVTPFWGDKACPAHSDDGTQRCTACHRLQPRSEQWAGLEDGRVLCLLCLGTVVPNTAAAAPLYDSIIAFYQKMGMTLSQRPPLSLVDNTALNAASSGQGPRPEGPIFHTRGLCITEYSQTVVTTILPAVRGFFGAGKDERQQITAGPRRVTVTAILVLAGLPRLLTGCILAHEMMHAWIRLGGYPDLPPEVEEGLCQLMALLWLEAQPEAQGRGDGGYEERLAAFLGHQIRTDPSYIYGDGLRAALEAFQRHGLATVLAHVRHAGRLPG